MTVGIILRSNHLTSWFVTIMIFGLSIGAAVKQRSSMFDHFDAMDIGSWSNYVRSPYTMLHRHQRQLSNSWDNQRRSWETKMKNDYEIKRRKLGTSTMNNFARRFNAEFGVPNGRDSSGYLSRLNLLFAPTYASPRLNLF